MANGMRNSSSGLHTGWDEDKGRNGEMGMVPTRNRSEGDPGQYKN